MYSLIIIMSIFWMVLFILAHLVGHYRLAWWYSQFADSSRSRADECIKRSGQVRREQAQGFYRQRAEQLLNDARYYEAMEAYHKRLMYWWWMTPAIDCPCRPDDPVQAFKGYL